MKKILLNLSLLTTLALICGLSYSQCVTEQEDDLESYTLGSMEGQSAFWVGWTPLSAEYGEVSNEQALSGSQSLKIEGIPAGGPVDQLYLLGDRTVGDWDITFSMYVPSGNSAYYNLQADQVPAVEWKHELYLFSDGSGGALTVNGAAGGPVPAFPQDEWFEIKQHIDQINDVTELFLDGNMIYTGPFGGGGLNQIGGLDFFPATNPADPNPNAIPLYYLDDVEMCANPFIPPPPSNNECAGIINLSSLFGAPVGSPQTGGPYDNSSATTEATDPADGWECYGALAPEPSLDNTLWFAFVGDGNTYDIITTDCGGGLTNYIDDGDTQMSIYTGSCGALTPHSCNEDAQIIPPNEYPAGFVGTETFSTDVGVTYYVMVDGFNFQGALSSGEYCIEITRTDNTGIEDVTSSEFGLVSVSPNPATNQIQIELSNAQARELNISIMSINGQQVYSRIATSNAGTDIIPINVESLAAGMYILQMRDEQAVTNVKFVVE